MIKTFDQIISTRRTVRHFGATKPMTCEELIPILEAGRLTPSVKNFQPLHFVVILSEKERTKLRAIGQQPRFCHAPSYIVVIGDHDKAWQRPHCDLIYVDTSITLTHMLLETEDIGLGAIVAVVFDQEICRELLQIPEHEEPALTSTAGHPDPAFAGKEGDPCHKTVEELVAFI